MPTTKTAHTPGPWTIGQGHIQPASDRCRILHGAGGGAIAFLNDWSDAPEQARANAHIIAAAPELLEAVRLTLQALDNLHAEKLQGLAGRYLPLMNQAREAIKKATE